MGAATRAAGLTRKNTLDVGLTLFGHKLQPNFPRTCQIKS